MTAATLLAFINLFSGCYWQPRAKTVSSTTLPPNVEQKYDYVTDSEEEIIVTENEHISTKQITIAELVQLGLQQNPSLHEASLRLQSLAHKIPQAMSLPDPMVSTTTHLSPVQTAAGAQAFGLGIRQKIPNIHKRETKASMVQDEIAIAQATLESKQIDIAEKIRSTSYQCLFVQESIKITEQDLDLLKQVAKMILKQFETQRETSQQDVLNVESEITKVESRLVTLRQQEQSIHARLTRLIGAKTITKFNITDRLQINESEAIVEQQLAKAFEQRPDLYAQLAQVQRDCKAVSLAYLDNVPDLTVGLNWIATSSSGISPVANGDDALMLGVGFNWPVYPSRIQAKICEMNAIKNASELRLQSLKDQASEEIYDLTFKLSSSRQTLQLLENDIIPKAKRSLDLSIDEYAEGKMSYVQLMANWRSLLNYRINAANLKTQYMQHQASLSRAVGDIGVEAN